MCSKTKTRNSSTHNGVAPEFGHLSDPHGGQQRLPDVQLEHVADHYLHGCPHHFAVIDHCAVVVTQLGAEVERHLGQISKKKRKALVWTKNWGRDRSRGKGP